MTIQAVAVISLWCGLVAGYLGMLGPLWIRYRGFFMLRSQDAIWLAPLANALLFLVVGIATSMVGLHRPGLRRRWVVFALLFLLAATVFAGFIMYSEPAWHSIGAVVLVAAGVALQLSRLLERRPGIERLIRRTAPFLVAVTVLIAAATYGQRRWTEGVALQRLSNNTAQTAPNVVVIILDTVRGMNLGFGGYARSTSPKLDRLAQEGRWFSRAFATTSWTLPSHASLFTGRDAHELSTDWNRPLDGTYRTVAEYLSEHGYATAGFVANTWYCGTETGLGRGFLHYDDYSFGLGRLAEHSHVLWMVLTHPAVLRLTNYRSMVWRKTASDVNRAFLDWVDRHQPTPFFAFLNYFDAHQPYAPPGEYAKRFQTAGLPLRPVLRPRRPDEREAHNAEAIQGGLDAYDGAIAYLDAHLGKLFDALGRRGLWDNTIVIVASDHGEEFGEHGMVEHGNSLYRPSVEIPLILRAPGRWTTGERIDAPVSLRHIPSTILDLLGHVSSPFPGHSLAGPLAAVAEDKDTVRATLTQAGGKPRWYPVSVGPVEAIILDGYRYIRNGDASEELYDLDSDPGERTNLANDSLHAAALIRLGSLANLSGTRPAEGPR